MPDSNAGRALYAEHQGTYVLKLVGDIRAPICATLDSFVESMFCDVKLRSILVDLSETQLIDSTALGLIAKIAVHTRKRFQEKPVIISTRPDITRILDSMGLEQVFDIVQEASVISSAMNEVPVERCVENSACQKVLEAHRVLMSLNEKNHETFKEVVAALEFDQFDSVDGSINSSTNCCGGAGAGDDNDISSISSGEHKHTG
ncbi:MAG: STAS domain-containing protein [Pseudomonadales bacterium]|nr:STAS domain-containing protein [Pseudomonadales bacterium]